MTFVEVCENKLMLQNDYVFPVLNECHSIRKFLYAGKTIINVYHKEIRFFFLDFTVHTGAFELAIRLFFYFTVHTGASELAIRHLFWIFFSGACFSCASILIGHSSTLCTDTEHPQAFGGDDCLCDHAQPWRMTVMTWSTTKGSNYGVKLLCLSTNNRQRLNSSPKFIMKCVIGKLICNSKMTWLSTCGLTLVTSRCIGSFSFDVCVII